MSGSIDQDLNALAVIAPPADLDGLEAQVWTAVQARKASAGSGAGVGAAVVAAALMAGVLFGVLHPLNQPPRHTEMGLLSEDGALAPSMRLGG